MSDREPRVGDTVEELDEEGNAYIYRVEETEPVFNVLFMRVLSGSGLTFWVQWDPTEWRIIDPPEDTGAGEGGL